MLHCIVQYSAFSYMNMCVHMQNLYFDDLNKYSLLSNLVKGAVDILQTPQPSFVETSMRSQDPPVQTMLGVPTTRSRVCWAWLSRESSLKTSAVAPASMLSVPGQRIYNNVLSCTI